MDNVNLNIRERWVTFTHTLKHSRGVGTETTGKMLFLVKNPMLHMLPQHIEYTSVRPKLHWRVQTEEMRFKSSSIEYNSDPHSLVL